MEKCGNIEIEKHKFHQYKRPTSIKNTDINTIDYLIRPLLVKKVLNISLATMMLKN